MLLTNNLSQTRFLYYYYSQKANKNLTSDPSVNPDFGEYNPSDPSDSTMDNWIDIASFY